MATAVKTNVTELRQSRVKVDAEIPADTVQRSLENIARKVGREMKLPGFRQGKIPPAVVIQRVGRDTLLDETIRESITDWYVKAVETARIAPVGSPEIAPVDKPDEGKPLTFTFEVGVRPQAKLGDYKGLAVGRREPKVDAEAIEAELAELRERLARLEVVKRPAENGDFLTIDFVGRVDGEIFSGGEGRDQLVELGAGQLIPGFEEGLVGATAGEERTIDAVFPDDYAAKHVAGKPARFEIAVKEVKHKELPALDDDFASNATGHDTLAELKQEITARLLTIDEERVQAEYRQAALDAVVGEAEVEIPEPLVDARAKELLERMFHTLEHQGISKEAYVKISGKSERAILEEGKPDAEQALRREAVLAAIIEAEGIEPSEQDLLDALEPAAEREQMSRHKLLERLHRAGRVYQLVQEVAAERVIDLVVDSAKPISVEEAEQRRAKAAAGEQLWTPEQGAPKAKPKAKPKARTKARTKPKAAEKKLWTPDS